MSGAIRRLANAIVLLSLAAAATPCHSATGYSLQTVSPPPGFDELQQPRRIPVDVYFGGRKIGEALATVRPGFIRLHESGQLLALVPGLAGTPALAERLGTELPANSQLVCSQTNSDRCGTLLPEMLGVIFDEEQFRVDLFINPTYLEPVTSENDVYLDLPSSQLSLTSSMGLALSGSNDGSPTYNFQNRTIVGFRNARIRSGSSFASGHGLVVDDLVGEIDSGRHRYSAGLFWVPGLDFTGRRRIAGIGVGTQFDTRSDRESLSGTPLVVFMPQPARVELLIDGRLVASGTYEAGNNMLDTASLPNGSYELTLRIREAGGTREERRFFVKNARIAPAGEPVYFAYAGMLANTRRNRPISLSDSIFYQFGAARRLSDSIAVDAAVLGTDKKVMAEAGAWLITRLARVRAAGLASSAGDLGALLQIGSAGTGRLNFNFDLRRIWSGDGKPLIPLPSHIDNFGSAPPTGAQVGSGSYAQASGTVAYRLGDGYVALTGSYRHDRGSPADYSIGPSLTWQLVNRRGFQLIMQADAQKTRTTTAAFVGFRLLYTSGGLSVMSTAGRGTLRSRDGVRRSRTRAVGSFSGQWSREWEDRTQLSLAAGVDRSVDSTAAHANGVVNSPFGSARADLLHNFEGRGGLQYGLTFQTGVAAAGGAVELGGRDLNESAVIASVGGTASGAMFDVLVDELPRGRIRTGSRLPIFLQAYRSYKVRLRPIGPVSADYDTATDEITLFPGNVHHLRWQAESQLTVFGQALQPDGKPVANALVTSRRGIGQADEMGYFQIEAAHNDLLEFASGTGDTCKISLAGLKPESDYVSLGKAVCR